MLSALPLLVPLLLVPASANASTLESGTGTFTATGEIISVKHVDGNTIVTATEVQSDRHLGIAGADAELAGSSGVGISATPAGCATHGGVESCQHRGHIQTRAPAFRSARAFVWLCWVGGDSLWRPGSVVQVW
jgi:hypothetical protein